MGLKKELTGVEISDLREEERLHGEIVIDAKRLFKEDYSQFCKRYCNGCAIGEYAGCYRHCPYINRKTWDSRKGD